MQRCGGNRRLRLAVPGLLAQDAGHLPGGPPHPRPHDPHHLQAAQEAGRHRGQQLTFVALKINFKPRKESKRKDKICNQLHMLFQCQ